MINQLGYGARWVVTIAFTSSTSHPSRHLTPKLGPWASKSHWIEWCRWRRKVGLYQTHSPHLYHRTPPAILRVSRRSVKHVVMDDGEGARFNLQVGNHRSTQHAQL